MTNNIVKTKTDIFEEKIKQQEKLFYIIILFIK